MLEQIVHANTMQNVYLTINFIGFLKSTITIGYNAFQALILSMFAYIYFPVFLYTFNRVFKRKKTKKATANGNKFILLIPAHNEERVLPKLLKSIENQSYPSDLLMSAIVADNCSDNTKNLFANNHSHTYIEKNTPGLSDKTQALNYAWKFLKENNADIWEYKVVIIDADCELDPDFLEKLDQCISAEDRTNVFQTFRYVRNAQHSNLTLLEAATEAIRQYIIIGSRDSMGLQAFICGSGVVFPSLVFDEVMKLNENSLVEDKLWQKFLIDKKIKAKWCFDAKLNYEVVQNHKDFQKQRKRWIGGQLYTARKHGLPSLIEGISKLNLGIVDFALSLLQLPRSMVMAFFTIFALVGFFLPETSFLSAWTWLALALCIFFYVGIGLKLINARPNQYFAIFESLKLFKGLINATFIGIFGKQLARWEAMRGIHKS